MHCRHFRYWRHRSISDMRQILFTLLIFAVSGHAAGEEVPAVKEKPDSPEALFRRAEDHFFEKRYRISLALFNKVLEKDPEYPGAYSYRGDIHLILGNLPEARENFLIAIEVSKEPSYEFFRLGQTYLLLKNGKEALASFEESLRRKPDLHLNRFYIGLVYFQLYSDRKETVRWWKEYLKLASDDPQSARIRLATEHLTDPSFKLPSELENPIRSDAE